MKIALLGYGKMGKAIEKIALQRGHEIVLRVSDTQVYEISKALYLATEGRKGPVWIDVPLDIQNFRINETSQEAYSPTRRMFPSCDKDISYLINYNILF